MKVWVFRILSVLLPPVILLVGAEGVLRLVGWGDSLEFAHRTELRGAPHWVNNPRFGRLFFPPQLSRACLPFQIPAARSANTLRVVVLGGSAAMGTPDPAYGLARMLEEMLRSEFAGVEVEVINTAITAVNSHVVLRIAEACAPMSPDLFVVYLGNNEVVGPYGAGTIFSPLSGNVALIRAGLRFRGTRLGQWTHALLRDDTALPASWRGMEMFRQNQVPADDPRMETVYANYARNLRDLLQVASDRGISTAVGTVAVNLRHCAPFGSQEPAHLAVDQRTAWRRAVDDANGAAAAEDYVDALAASERAVAIWPGSAELHFRRGRWRDAMGDPAAARVAYERARDLDTLRFRHDSTLAARLREVVTGFEGRGVHLVETVRAVEAASPTRIPGREMFLEHVHFTPEGTYQVAREFFETVRHLVPPRVARTARGAPPLPYDATCDAIALTPWDRHRVVSEVLGMLGHPPFVDQSNHTEQMDAVKAIADSLATGFDAGTVRALGADYRRAIQAHPSAWILRYRFGGFLLNTGLDPRGAADIFGRIAAEFPHFPAARNELGSALAAQGKMREAAAVLVESLELDPFQPATHNNLGNCLLSLANPASREQAIRHYERAHQLDPNPTFLVNWNLARHEEARWLVTQSRIDEAMALLRRILDADPDDPEAHYNLASLLARRGEREAAAEHLREVLRTHPHDPQATALLRRLQASAH